MKKYLALVASLVLFACSEPAQKVQEEISPWQEGIHYTVLEQEGTQSPQVQEFFSFWCPHCYNFEPFVAALKAQLDSDVQFSKVHVDFMGFTSQEMQQQASTAMIVARHMGKEASIIEAIFDHIHVKQQQLNSLETLKAILAANQISVIDYENAVEQSDVREKIEAHNNTFTQYRGDIKSVPTFIVNGKYHAKFVKGMTVDDMLALILWLTKQQ